MRTFLHALVVGVLLVNAAEAAPAELHVGRASVDITPPPGTPMLTPQRPPFKVKLAGDAHDPLQAKAIVLQEGDVRAALVSCDLTSIPLKIINEARQRIAEETEIPAEAVIISATHTHTTPQIRLKYLMNADETAKRQAAEYVEQLPRKIAEAVRLAEKELQPGTVSAAKGTEETVGFNRRFFLQDGTVESNPFKGDDARLTEVVRAVGPTDPELGVVAFHDFDGNPLAIMLNFSLHLDTMGGDQPSADFAHVVEARVQESLGADVMVFWASAASGNVNHYDLLDPERPRREKGPHESARIGTLLAAEALRAYADREVLQESPLRATGKRFQLAYRPTKIKGLQKVLEDAAEPFDGEVYVSEDNGDYAFEVEVVAIALGNELAWVSFPGEMFVELGISLKAASPFEYTMIHTLANGSIGYVPNLRAYPEGSYGAAHSRCAAGGGERLVEVATLLLIELKNEKESLQEVMYHATSF